MTGYVGSGKRISAGRLARIPDLPETLGYTPLPGTLNLALDRAPSWAGGIHLGGHRAYPVTLTRDGRTAAGHLIRWANDTRSTSVEVISEIHLRTELRLHDRDTVTVTIHPTE